MMLGNPQKLAPEPLRTAYLHVLHRVAVYVRSCSRGDHKISDDQLFDIMDAVHNIPEMLLQYGHYFDDEFMRGSFLLPYDEKWAEAENGIGLIAELDYAIAALESREAE